MPSAYGLNHYQGFSGFSGAAGSGGGGSGSDFPYTQAFVRDMSAAAGNQSITGVGFAPSSVMVFYVKSGGNTSVGNVIWTIPNVASGGCTRVSGGLWYPTNQIYFQNSSGNILTGDLASLDADGFTITWAKTGSPTGTLICYFTAWP